MSDFKDKLQLFIDHFDSLSTKGEDADDGFNAEFMTLKAESQVYKESNTFPAESGQQPYNKKKNRFKDILPFEYTRVQLHKIEGVEGSDYINANYVQGSDGNVTYIAAQGPLPHTINDFWRMLWYHQIEIVVMACKEVEMGKRKCECYWPPVGESQYYGAIKVTTRQQENISDDFIVRELFAECQGEEQVIRQYHYNAWPDHGRPSSPVPIIRMIEMIKDHRKRHDIPIVVHCSAGCGRTGTIIAIDFARTMLLAENIPQELNVYSIAHEMRKQRPAMVQAKDQYIFVYFAIMELVTRILGNVPQPPPKQLNFEKESPPKLHVPHFSDTNIYENVPKQTPEGSPEIDRKTFSTNNVEMLTPEKPSKVPPKPVARSVTASKYSSSSNENGNSKDDTKPVPPPKPKPPVKPSVPVKPEKPDKPDISVKPERQPEVLPRKKIDPPIPIPRKHSPIPNEPLSTPSQAPPTSTPTATPGYVNVPKEPPPVVDYTYSVVTNVKNEPPVPVPRMSTPKGKSSQMSSTSMSSDTSSQSILETLIMECGDVLSEDDYKEVTGTDKPPGEDTSYSFLGSVQEEDLPPDVPVQTLDSTQFLVGQTPPVNEESIKIYELPDPTPPIPTHRLASSPLPPIPTDDLQSSSLAHVIATMKPNQQDDLSGGKGGSKRPKGFNPFKNKGKEKNRSSDDSRIGLATPGSHQTVNRTPSAGIHVSPTKHHPVTTGGGGIRRGGVNDKYQFPGELGYGKRVGKPAGPRPVPSHWNLPNGLIH